MVTVDAALAREFVTGLLAVVFLLASLLVGIAFLIYGARQSTGSSRDD